MIPFRIMPFKADRNPIDACHKRKLSPIPAKDASMDRFLPQIRRLPHFFEIVEVADFGAEDMDDDIA